MKKYLKAWGLSFGLLLAFCVPVSASAASCNNMWTDIQSNTELCTAAKYMYDHNIMYGYGDQFGVKEYSQKFENRATAMAIILRALDSEYFKTIDIGHPPYASSFPFKDLPPGSAEWWYTYLRRMVDLGGVNGYADGTFRGGNRVTRAEFVKMFLNLSPYMTDIYGIDIYGKKYFSGDMANRVGDWHARYFAFIEMNYPLRKAFQNSRCPAPNYCPDYEITRDEAVLFLYYYHKWTGQDIGTTNPNPTPTPPPPAPPTLGKPVLNSPSHNMTYYGSNPTVNFNWYSTKGAVKYDLMIKYGSNANYATYQTTNPNFTIPSSYFPSLSLSPSGYLHRWKVRAYDSNGNWTESDERYIYVYNQNNLTTPALVYPQNNITFYGSNPQLTVTWGPSTGAIKYDVMVMFGGSNSYTVYPQNYSSNGQMSYYIPVQDFPSLTTNYSHYWKVRAYDANGNWKDSEVRTIYVYKDPLLTAPTLLSPNHGQTYFGNQNTTFNWNEVNGATKYDFMIQFGNSNGYSVYTVGAGVNHYYLPASTFPSVANNGYTHYWKVRAYDANGNWKESEVRSLIVNKIIKIQFP